jgi:hypothetical protein
MFPELLPQQAVPSWLQLFSTTASTHCICSIVCQLIGDWQFLKESLTHLLFSV